MLLLLIEIYSRLNFVHSSWLLLFSIGFKRNKSISTTWEKYFWYMFIYNWCDAIPWKMWFNTQNFKCTSSLFIVYTYFLIRDWICFNVWEWCRKRKTFCLWPDVNSSSIMVTPFSATSTISIKTMRHVFVRLFADSREPW